MVLIRYAGVLTKNTLDPDVNIKPKSRSTVAYQWTFCAGGIIAEKKVFLRCDNVELHGVPLPDNWQVAFRAWAALPMISQRSAAKAKAESGHRCLQCKVLGAARPMPELAGPSQEEQVGSLMVLSGPGGSRCAAVLCAHVQGMQWFYYECCDGDVAAAIGVDQA